MFCFPINTFVKNTILASLAIAIASATTRANQIYTPVAMPVTPTAGDGVPRVDQVPGKEFTDSLDMDYRPTPHAVQPSRIGRFDGIGGAENSLRLSDYATAFVDNHIDAQAQIRDPLFVEASLNRSALVVSTSFDQMLGNDTALAAERIDGSVESFATRTQVVNHPHVGGVLRDINSVDLWGTEGAPRAGFYSFANEPGNVSVYTLQVLAPGFLNPYLTQLDIAGALGNELLAPFIDVDALMVHDVGTGFNPFDGEFGPGDSVMFSIAPIPNPDGGDFFDGGEVWVWEFGSPAEYLRHGGHVWNTAFDVGGTFRVNTENIDALEAVGVPEPATLAATLLGLACMTFQRRR